MQQVSKTLDTFQLLRQWREGDSAAGSELFVHLYDELKHLAASRVANEGPRSDLGATELLHEAYFRLVDQSHAEWQDRAQFFAVAARVMRRIVIDKARERLAEKRGAGQPLLPLHYAEELNLDNQPEDLVALDRCLEALGTLDPDRLRLVELRFFAGLSLEETAKHLGLSRASVVRRWRVTRGWLRRNLGKSQVES